jgi:hypothetical protein
MGMCQDVGEDTVRHGQWDLGMVPRTPVPIPDMESQLALWQHDALAQVPSLQQFPTRRGKPVLDMTVA